MAHRVADEGEALQDDERPHDGANDPDQDCRHEAALQGRASLESGGNPPLT